jgi:excisionase family DNA binding protein
MTEPIADGWITTEQAEACIGYASAYLRRLANQGRVEALKIGRDWLINQESLLAYKREMDALGRQRHNPWRKGLVEQGKGCRPNGQPGGIQ